MNVIELSDVSFSFGPRPMLEHISFSIKKGQYVAIIGPNGGGKTTLLKLILGLIKPTSGAVSVHTGERFGYVPQRSIEYARFPATVEEVVHSGHPQHPDETACAEAMHELDVYKFKKRLIGDLSGGECQRVFIARALAAKPTILALDEPYAGIDQQAQEQFYATIEALHNNMQMTILFVTHDIERLEHTAQRCICVNRHMVLHGKTHDVIAHEDFHKLYA